MLLRGPLKSTVPKSWSSQSLSCKRMLAFSKADKKGNKGNYQPEGTESLKGEDRDNKRVSWSLKPDFKVDETKFRQVYTERGGRKIKLLTPVVLSNRVKELCERGHLQEALDMVKASPKDAQNAAVWGTLIGYVAETYRYQESYRLFTEMKRRGIRPTSRTYSTLLKGYTQIEDWTDLTVQFNNVCNLHDQLLNYFDLKKKEPHIDAEELNNIPFNLLIEIFGKAREYRRMFDVYNAMDTKGPLAPNIFTYTILLKQLAKRKTLRPSPQATEIDERSPTEVAYKNATDARLIWQQILKLPEGPDSHSIRVVLISLSNARPSDQSFALDILRDYVGLVRPGERSIPPKVPLHSHMITLAMSTANKLSQYRTAIYYLEQIMDSQHKTLLTRAHLELVIEAHVVLASSEPEEARQALDLLEWMVRESLLPQSHVEESGLGERIKPGFGTYDLVALACFHAGDWKSLSRTFEIFTGHEIGRFQGDIRFKPRLVTKGSQVWPSGRFMACLLRTANKTGDAENVRTALNIFQYYEFVLSPILNPERHIVKEDPTDAAAAEKRLLEADSLANAFVSVIPPMLEKEMDKMSRAKWSDWLVKAKGLKSSVARKPVMEQTLV